MSAKTDRQLPKAGSGGAEAWWTGAGDPAAKGFRRGTHRLIPPRETLERLAPLLPVLGITRLANVTGLDCIGLPVVVVCRPNSRSLAVAQGKGLDLAAAKASGLMESIEFHHAERINLPLKLASYNELRYTHPLVDPESLPQLSVSAFHDHLRILWIEGHDLLGGGPRWVPYEMVHMDYTLPLPSGSGCFVMSSSGLASGNHPLEAACHAICEVVERDAESLWRLRSRSARARTRLDPATIDDPDCLDVLDRIERAGMLVAIWETTSDVGIPVFRCSFADRRPSPVRPIFPGFGTGCHPARPIALLRALTEAAQSRLTRISSSRDDVPRSDYELTRNPDVMARMRSELEAEPPVRSFLDAPTFAGETFADDLGWLLERLRSAGITSAVAVDLTQRGFGIPVVRVVIPGLEGKHGAAGYAPGPRARQVAGSAEVR